MAKFKLAVAIPFSTQHKLPTLTELLFRHMNYLRHTVDNCELILVSVGSCDDDKQLANKYNIPYRDVPNHPIDFKYDDAYLLAKEFNPDGVGLIGSDDFFFEPLYTRVTQLLTSGEYDGFGMLDAYIYDVPNGNFWHWEGYENRHCGYYPDGAYSRKGESIPSARFVTKQVADAMNWQPFDARNMNIPRHKLYWAEDERNWYLMKKHCKKIWQPTMRMDGIHYFNVKIGQCLTPIRELLTNHSMPNSTGYCTPVWREHVDKINQWHNMDPIVL